MPGATPGKCAKPRPPMRPEVGLPALKAPSGSSPGQRPGFRIPTERVRPERAKETGPSHLRCAHPGRPRCAGSRPPRALPWAGPLRAFGATLGARCELRAAGPRFPLATLCVPFGAKGFGFYRRTWMDSYLSADGTTTVALQEAGPGTALDLPSFERQRQTATASLRSQGTMLFTATAPKAGAPEATAPRRRRGGHRSLLEWHSGMGQRDDIAGGRLKSGHPPRIPFSTETGQLNIPVQ